MRLCFVAQEQAGVTHERTGGIGTWMAGVTGGLSERGHDVHVVVPEPAGSRVTRPQRDGLSVHPVICAAPPLARALEGHWVWPRRCARQIARLEPFDVVIAHDFNGPAVGYSAARRTSPLVTHLHSSFEQVREVTPDRPRGRLAPVLGPLQRRREQVQTRNSDAVAGCSQAVLGDSVRRWHLDPPICGVVHSVIDVNRVRRLAEGPCPSHVAEIREPFVMFSGTLFEAKGVIELALAMRSLWDEGGVAPLVLAGLDRGYQHGSMVGHLRSLVGPHADRLKYLGPLKHEDLFPALRRAAVVAMPSHWEALPMALVEAGAIGCALVTTSGHGADDVVTHGVDALVVERHQSAPLAAAINRLLRDRALAKRLGEAATTRAQYFGFDAGLKRFEEFYSAVAERGLRR
jgi:glycosyltransferase involved in cell wall biosynthesis